MDLVCCVIQSSVLQVSGDRCILGHVSAEQCDLHAIVPRPARQHGQGACAQPCAAQHLPQQNVHLPDRLDCPLGHRPGAAARPAVFWLPAGVDTFFVLIPAPHVLGQVLGATFFTALVPVLEQPDVRMVHTRPAQDKSAALSDFYDQVQTMAA